MAKLRKGDTLKFQKRGKPCYVGQGGGEHARRTKGREIGTKGFQILETVHS